MQTQTFSSIVDAEFGTTEYHVLMNAWTAFRQGRNSYTAKVDGIRFTVTPQALACDCGKGLYCPLIKQTIR